MSWHFNHYKDCGLLAVFLICFGCASGSVRETKGPTVSEAQAVSARGPKARIAVAQFVNNSGGLEAQMQRMAAQSQALSANMTRQMMELQKKMIPYQRDLMAWQAKVQAVGEEAAGPPPEAPTFEPTSSPYMATVSDPVAGGLRDMMINALFHSGKFIVLERQTIDHINWEQEFSHSGRVGEKVRIPMGQIEGAEVLLIGSLNTLEAKQSGGSLGGVASSAISLMPFSGVQYAKEVTEGSISWESAKVAMDLRLVDTRTSRVVAATTVDGRATSVELGASKTQYTYNAGKLPVGFSVYHNTPVEEAFREMVNAAVGFIVSQTPGHYYHY
jgi:curli biogenesis system outer membrane secretion channel CsgG